MDKKTLQNKSVMCSNRCQLKRKGDINVVMYFSMMNPYVFFCDFLGLYITGNSILQFPLLKVLIQKNLIGISPAIFDYNHSLRTFSPHLQTQLPFYLRLTLLLYFLPIFYLPRWTQYRIFLLFHSWLPCHFYIVVIEQLLITLAHYDEVIFLWWIQQFFYLFS